MVQENGRTSDCVNRNGRLLVIDCTNNTSCRLKSCPLIVCDEATRRHGAVILRGVSDEVREGIEVAGFDVIFVIE